MTDNEIIEQIKTEIRLAEYGDNSYTDVTVELLKNALKLINRQKTEIKRLEQEFVYGAENFFKKIENLVKEMTEKKENA